MSATLTSGIHIDKIKKFIKEFDETQDYYFLFAGRVQPWADETAPDTAINSYETIKDVRKSLIFMKQLQSANGVLGLKRYNWTSGNIYTPWQSDKDMPREVEFAEEGRPFFVFVEDYETTGILIYSVFLCLDNSSGSASTIMPTGQLASSFTTVDGYRWKFMYSIAPELYDYINNATIPYPIDDSQKTVSHLNVESNTPKGTIDHIRIENGGTGYTEATTIDIIGDGEGATADYEIDDDGTITNVSIISEGSGYTYASIAIDGIGTGAELTAMVSPVDGHGYDAAEQLNASYAIIRVSFINNENNKFPTQNTYRRFGIIKNIKDNTEQLAIEDQYNFFDELEMSDLSDTFLTAQLIQGEDSGATARIYYQDPPGGVTSATFYVVDRVGNFSIGEVVFLVSDPTISGTLDNITLNPLDRQSGNLLYYENIQFLSRKDGQTERFIIPIEF